MSQRKLNSLIGSSCGCCSNRDVLGKVEMGGAYSLVWIVFTQNKDSDAPD